MQKQPKIDQESLMELQLLEQNLQNFLMQKQAQQIELNEIVAALSEIEKLKTSEQAYKIIGTVMIKSEKKDLKKELSEKKDILELRIKNITQLKKAIKKHKIAELKGFGLKTEIEITEGLKLVSSGVNPLEIEIIEEFKKQLG